MKDPLILLEEKAWSKGMWSAYTKTMVSTYFERKLREDALGNSRMGLFNISLNGLTGKPHYLIQNIFTTVEVKKARIHIKMLSGDYLTYGTLALQSAARGKTFSGHCRICSGIWEDVQHILTECEATLPARVALLPKMSEIATTSPTSTGCHWLSTLAA